MEIIPAIDLLDGKCVRLTKGDYSSQKVYSEDPLEVARMFEDWGIKRLHLVDLDGARARHIVNYRMLNNIASKTSLKIDFGGGIATGEDLRTAFESGASMVTGGSIAVREPETFLSWLVEYGPERIILGADHRKEKIAVSGWTEESDSGLFGFLEFYTKKGIRRVICTDIDVDGMLTGPSVKTYADILEQFPGIHLTASGGVGNIEDLDALERIDIQAVIVGKAIYEGKISAEEIISFLNR
jgi:phosphoribosylformimino-5-aminoimidazole carboxamide ribotide isomerase